MLTIHESLIRFRALVSANNHKMYDLPVLLSKVSLYYVCIPSYSYIVARAQKSP